MAPAAIRITEVMIKQLGTERSILGVADVIAFLFLNFSEFILAGFLAVRSYRRRRAGAATPST
ncbi:MAG: hypothetical protein M3N98_11680, partial [Actinomycetota bacterium]|nr:hypothetical protein [Actinomycetota bacterium]